MRAKAEARKGALPTDLQLNPYLIHFGPFGIRWYGFFMAVSMAIGIYYLVRRGLHTGVDEDTLYNFALLAILGGVIGARLIYVLTNWSYFAQQPGQILRVDQGGLSIHGALLGGFVFSIWYAYRRALPYWAVLDGMVPGVVVGVFLVRIGNIFNGEILGHPAGILGGARHPAQVYEMVFAILLWVVYWRQLRRDPADGVAFWTFIVWYSVLRFVSELFRDNPHYLINYTNPYLGIGVLTLEQIFTPLVLVLALLALRWRRAMDVHTLTTGPKWTPPETNAATAAGGGVGDGSA